MKSHNPCFAGAYGEKKILVTGHTGFKGSWLCEWLLQLGAEITGYSLPPETSPALFRQIGLEHRLHHIIGDIRDLPKLNRVVRAVQPDFVFHLAAQPLVRDSYVHPLETFETNVTGTVNLLQSLRLLKKPCATVFITTDKCYENREWRRGYSEADPLGGYDPYSASKAAAEIAIGSWRRSFFKGHPVKIASARAGNVIGGGDWSTDRILPDCVRALKKNRRVAVRNPGATRPWQHILEPLGGYLWLGVKISRLKTGDDTLCSAFNFGPDADANRTVRELVSEVVRHWPGKWEKKSDPDALHEAGLLQLDTTKARRVLGWRPVWNFHETVAQTINWYRGAKSPEFARRLLAAQISGYCEDARRSRLPWVK